MAARISLEGWNYRLRSPKASEALSPEPGLHLILENRLSGAREGTATLLPEEGRAVVRTDAGSEALSEAWYLSCRIAFEQLDLARLSLEGEPARAVSREAFYSRTAPELEQQAAESFRRNLEAAIGPLEFHHIGVATRSIEKELPVYTLLGYGREGGFFEDPAQGIRGLFLSAPGHPRLELLENLPGSHTLDQPLERGQKLYHTAYYVRELEKAVAVFSGCRAKLISPPKPSVYFGGRICFLMLPNMGMIELMEKI